MKYVVFLIVFALVFSGIVYGTQSADSIMAKNEKVQVKSYGTVNTISKVKSPGIGIPPGVPGLAQPKLKLKEEKKRGGTTPEVIVEEGTCNRILWQPVRGRPVRNLACLVHNRRPIRTFFQNRRPVRRIFGWIVRGRCR